MRDLRLSVLSGLVEAWATQLWGWVKQMGVAPNFGFSTAQLELRFQKPMMEPSQDIVEGKLRAYCYTQTDSNTFKIRLY